jgi:lipid A 3-O-deacylase
MNKGVQPIHPAVLAAIRCRRFLCGTLGLCGGIWLLAAAPVAHGWDTSEDTWALLGGYGQSFPGWGQTTQRVETIDLIPRYTHRMSNTLGSDWYEGVYSTMVELPLHVVVDPDESAMIGLNFLACYTFTANDQWRPYIFGGGGPVYSFADIPGMGASWNGNYQFALGLEHRLDTGTSLLFEIRYHHISNAGAEEPNDPLNSVKVLAGFSF